jgi:hypothetical protein
MARFDRLKRRALFEKLLRWITRFERLSVVMQAEKCLCGCHLCLKLVRDGVCQYG